MEDNDQIFKPDQNSAGTPPPSPGPQPQAPSPAPPPPSPSNNWSPADSSSGSSSAAGKLSLLLSASAVGIFILLIFVTGLVDSLTKAYIWFFIILTLGVAGLIFGLRSEKDKANMSILGLVGIMVSVIVIINCLVIGSYYIKLQMELNKFKSQFNSGSSSDLNIDYDNDLYQGL